MTQTEKPRRPGVRRSPKLTAQDSPALLESAPVAAVAKQAAPDSNAFEQAVPAPKRGRPRKSEPSVVPAAFITPVTNVAKVTGDAKDNDNQGKSSNGKVVSEKSEQRNIEAESLNTAEPKRGRGRPAKKKAEVAEDVQAASLEEVSSQPLLSSKSTTRKTSPQKSSSQRSAPQKSLSGVPRKVPTRTAAKLNTTVPQDIFAVSSGTVTLPGITPATQSTGTAKVSGAASNSVSATFPDTAPMASEAATSPVIKTTGTSRNLSRDPLHHKDTAESSPGRASKARPKTSLLKGRTPERSAFKHQAQNEAAPVVPAPVVTGATDLTAKHGVQGIKPFEPFESAEPVEAVQAVKEGNDTEPKPRSNKKNAMEQFYARAYAKKDNYPAEKTQSIFGLSGGGLSGKAQQKQPGRRHATAVASAEDSLPPQKSGVTAARGSAGRSDVPNSSDNKSANLNNKERQQRVAGFRDGEQSVSPVSAVIQEERQDKREASGKAAGRLPRPLRSGNSGRGGKNISSVYRPERVERPGEENVEISSKSTDRPNQSARPGQYGQSGNRFEMRENAPGTPEREALPRRGGEFKPGREAESRPESRSMRESEARPMRETGFKSGQGAPFKASGDAGFKAANENLRNNPRQQKKRDENFDHGKADKDNRRGRISNWPTRPARPPKDGIKASSKGFVESWWGRSWLSSLEEALGHSTRLQRGRQYAKAGHVTQIVVEKCRVKATVCGNHVYHVHFRLSPLNFKAWSIVGRVLGSQAALAARLLNGELPEEINHGLARAGLSLIPDFGSELSTQCSCPDKSNPCKHIAAVHYLLAEEIDRDPFLLLCLRGKEREEVIALMAGQSPGQSSGRKPEPCREAAGSDPGRRRVLSGGSPGDDASPDNHSVDSTHSEPDLNVVHEAEDEGTHSTKRNDGKPLSKLLYAAPEPMPSIPDFFWGRILSIQPLPMPGAAQAPETPDALPSSLGAFPFWRGEEDLHQALQEVYSKATQKGMGDAEEAKDEF